MEGILSSGIKCKTVVCPPSIFLAGIQELAEDSSLQIGAQNLDWHEDGAYTGEISAKMLREFGCEYSIVGHSERRGLYGESNEQVALKFAACLEAGITPILCLGETRDQRMAGETDQVIERQLMSVIKESGVEVFGKAVIAYEPVWAIGTGETASPEQADEVHGNIRDLLAGSNVNISENIQILYGGSVNEGNAAELFAMPNIDGALVGGASLSADAFVSICRSAHN